MPLYPTETAVTRFAQAGVAIGQYAIVDTNGYPMGTTGLISNGQARGMGIMTAVKRFGNPAPAPREVPVTGDNGNYRAKFIFPPGDLTVLDLVFGVMSMDFHAAVTNAKQRTIGQWNAVLGEHNARFNQRQVCLLVNNDISDADTGVYGPQRYANWFYPLANVYPMFSNFQEAAAAEWAYKASPTQANKWPWGEAFTLVNEGATRAARALIATYYPLTMDTFLGDGTTTSFTLSWTPATDNTGSGVRMYRNGTPVTGWTNVGRTFSFGSLGAGAAYDVNVIVYEAVDILTS